ncbi:MAG: lipocalin family protein, partial [Rikenellaceae bacterium]|nr:lipocalin family protein [Rikenellaceae bacterium]
IGSRSPRYLWILSRTPTLPDATINNIIDVPERRGYNTKNLIFDEP